MHNVKHSVLFKEQTMIIITTVTLALLLWALFVRTRRYKYYHINSALDPHSEWVRIFQNLAYHEMYFWFEKSLGSGTYFLLSMPHRDLMALSNSQKRMERRDLKILQFFLVLFLRDTVTEQMRPFKGLTTYTATTRFPITTTSINFTASLCRTST